MAELAVLTKRLNFHLEQVQDFTPTPMTLATEIYYTGYHPYTLEKLYCAISPEEKRKQRRYFFWYKPEERRELIQALQSLHRPDLIEALFGQYVARQPESSKKKNPRQSSEQHSSHTRSSKNKSSKTNSSKRR